MKRIAIVSSFISFTGHQQEGQRFLLLHRASRSRLHANKWGVCTGKITPNDSSIVNAALREIREETSLQTSSNLFLETVGAVQAILHEHEQIEWIIYPLLWTLVANRFSSPEAMLNQVVLNDEHSQASLVNEEDFADTRVVPGLSNTLQELLSKRKSQGV